MRRVEPRQLTFVFADSPEGGKGSRKRDESRGRPYLLHIAKATNATSSAVLPPLSVGEMTLRRYGTLSYSQNSARDLRCALNGA